MKNNRSQIFLWSRAQKFSDVLNFRQNFSHKLKRSKYLVTNLHHRYKNFTLTRSCKGQGFTFYPAKGNFAGAFLCFWIEELDGPDVGLKIYIQFCRL